MCYIQSVNLLIASFKGILSVSLRKLHLPQVLQYNRRDTCPLGGEVAYGRLAHSRPGRESLFCGPRG